MRAEPKFLPGTGRGTARRSRVVEGARDKRATGEEVAEGWAPPTTRGRPPGPPPVPGRNC